GVSIVRKTPSHRFDPWAPVAPLAAKNNGFVRLASLESGVASRAGGLPFDRFASFNDRFRGAAEPFAPDAADAGDGQTRALLPADGAAETAPLGPRRRPAVTLPPLAAAAAGGYPGRGWPRRRPRSRRRGAPARIRPRTPTVAPPFMTSPRTPCTCRTAAGSRPIPAWAITWTIRASST